MNTSVFIAAETAYAGEAGKLRENFCSGYITKKKHSLQYIDEEINRQIQGRGETITCRKGCPDCCVAYIEANIQECEAIAYYLYTYPNILDSFLDRYYKWRSLMRQISSAFARCEAILHQDTGDDLSGDDQAALLEVLKNYQKQNLPCSFLERGVCMIHEVRPYVCANHLVTTPASWCRAENWCDPDAPHHPRIYMTAIDELYETVFYPQNLAKPVVGFMPTMVYRIMTEGDRYIRRLTGQGKTDIS